MGFQDAIVYYKATHLARMEHYRNYNLKQYIGLEIQIFFCKGFHGWVIQSIAACASIL